MPGTTLSGLRHRDYVEVPLGKGQARVLVIIRHSAEYWRRGDKWMGFRLGKEVGFSKRQLFNAGGEGEEAIQGEFQFYFGNQAGRMKSIR